jgi:hypothetical protein
MHYSIAAIAVLVTSALAAPPAIHKRDTCGTYAPETGGDSIAITGGLSCQQNTRATGTQIFDDFKILDSCTQCYWYR